MTTKKGITTKKRLFELSKECFLKYGYKKTTIDKISKTAGISTGNFTYYFNSKDILVKEIFDDYCYKILEYVNNNLMEKINDEPADIRIEMQYICNGMIFVNNILANDASSSFLKEAVEKSSLYGFMEPLLRPLYDLLDKKYSLRFNSPIIFFYRTHAEQGALKGLILSYLENKNIPTLDFSMLAMHFSSVAIGIPENTYYSIGIKCYKLLRELDFSNIKLL